MRGLGADARSRLEATVSGSKSRPDPTGPSSGLARPRERARELGEGRRVGVWPCALHAQRSARGPAKSGRTEHFLSISRSCGFPRHSHMIAAQAQRTTRGPNQRGDGMTLVIGYHEIDDSAHWLASPKREEVFGPLGITVRTFLDPENPNRAAVLADVSRHGRLSGSDAVPSRCRRDGLRRRSGRHLRPARRGVARRRDERCGLEALPALDEATNCCELAGAADTAR